MAKTVRKGLDSRHRDMTGRMHVHLRNHQK